jgi:hypothetical protein
MSINTIKAVAIYGMLVATIAMAMASCASTKYHTCDAYKTHYKALKPERHKSHHHNLCDAYN